MLEERPHQEGGEAHDAPGTAICFHFACQGVSVVIQAIKSLITYQVDELIGHNRTMKRGHTGVVCLLKYLI